MKNWKIVREIEMENLKSKAVELEHKKSGAKYIHIANDDPHNAFCVYFPTFPSDSTGVAHILEHTALTGSVDFPVRDPFFSMIRRSLHTFLNAVTWPGKTAYPFASANAKDFANLREVYLDAAFFPLLKRENFLQEGWRYDIESVSNDPKMSSSEFSQCDQREHPENIGGSIDTLKIAGVVYNEMKGALSDPSRLLGDAGFRALFPGGTYGYESGGEPRDIPDLTHENLKKFHKKFYNPANAHFFSYGDVSLEENLAAIDAAIEKCDEMGEKAVLVAGERFEKPRVSEISYPLAEKEDNGRKSHVLVAWQTGNLKNMREIWVLDFLESILLGDDAAPLRKALLGSGFGESLASGSGLEAEIRDPVFGAGLQNCAEADAEKIEALILDTLQNVAKNGVKMEKIEAVLAQMEMGVREIADGWVPYNLGLWRQIAEAWLHGGDVMEILQPEESLAWLRENVVKKEFLTDRIEKYFLKNNHRVRVVLKPDHEMEKRENDALRRELDEKMSEMSEGERQKVVAEAEGLKKMQEMKEDLSCLPTLELVDVPREVKYPSFAKNGNVTTAVQPTNGVGYAWANFEVAVCEEDLIFLPVLAYLLTRVGAGKKKWEDFVDEIALAGGVSASVAVTQVSSKTKVSFGLAGKFLPRNEGKVWSIFEDLAKNVDFSDLGRIKLLFKKRAVEIENGFLQSGHRHAILLAGRGLGEVEKLREEFGGVSQMKLAKKLAKMDEKGIAEVCERLVGMREKVFGGKSEILCVGDENVLDLKAKNAKKFVEQIKSSGEVKKVVQKDENIVFAKDFWTIQTPVNYVAVVRKCVDLSHADSPALAVLAMFLNRFTHAEVREKGGAYGGQTNFSEYSGIFYFVSYRDPNLEKTLAVFEKALGWIKNQEIDDEVLVESILQTIGGIDDAEAPAATAVREWCEILAGRSREMREKFRNGVLAVRKEDLVRVAEKYLGGKASVAVICDGKAAGKVSGFEVRVI